MKWTVGKGISVFNLYVKMHKNNLRVMVNCDIITRDLRMFPAIMPGTVYQYSKYKEESYG